MKKLKTLLSLALAAMAVAVVFTACSSSTTEEESTDVTLQILDTEYTVEDYAIAVSKDNTELYEAIETALNELIDDGTAQLIIDKYIEGTDHDLEFQTDTEGKEELVMGTNAEFPPYEYYDGDDIVGIDAEMAAAIADKLDMKLVIEDMSFDSIITSVTSGKIDMGMAGLTVTEERATQVDFTTSYAQGVQVVIVAEGSEITSVDDLFADDASYTIGVQTSTTGDLYATWDLEDAGLATVSRYNKGADAVAALVSGKVDCVIIDNEPAKAFVEANNG
ncbi:MAG: transporter substrate-binding domain-containing protein [Clostridia bacterium]